MRATIGEREPRSGNQVSHRAGDQHLVRAGEVHDARANVNGDSGDSGLHDLELSRVEARTDLDPQLVDAVDDRESATDRARRPVEDGQESIASAVDLATAKTG